MLLPCHSSLGAALSRGPTPLSLGPPRSVDLPRSVRETAHILANILSRLLGHVVEARHAMSNERPIGDDRLESFVGGDYRRCAQVRSVTRGIAALTVAHQTGSAINGLAAPRRRRIGTIVGIRRGDEVVGRRICKDTATTES